MKWDWGVICPSILVLIIAITGLIIASAAVTEPHLQPVNGELIQEYQDTIEGLQTEIDSLRECNKALRDKNFELLRELTEITDGYLDRLLELFEDDKGREEKVWIHP